MLFKTDFENYVHFTQRHDIEFKVPYGENQNAQSVYVFEQTSPIIQMKLKQCKLCSELGTETRGNN